MNYIFFWDGPFCQWKHSPMTLGNNTFNCAEQFMMYYKAICFKDTIIAEKILASNNPRDQKALGRDVKNYRDSDWNKVRQDVVWIGNYLKFTQNEELKKRLLDTEDKLLVEASPYDRIWGIGYEAHEAMANVNNWGQNLLGKTITNVRDFIVSGASTENLVFDPEKIFITKGVWK